MLKDFESQKCLGNRAIRLRAYAIAEKWLDLYAKEFLEKYKKSIILKKYGSEENKREYFRNKQRERRAKIKANNKLNETNIQKS